MVPSVVTPQVVQRLDDSSVKARLCGVGVLTREQAHDLGCVGPMLRALYWEAIAVPELRRHTLALARHLLAPPAS